MLLSIITVCLNASDTIKKTIECVRSCDVNQLEYIIVDGGSVDNTIDIINQNRECIDRVVSESDCGIYDAMNKGARIASGDWVGFLNSGDIYIPGAVKKVCDYLEGDGKKEDIIYGRSLIVDETGQEVRIRSNDKIRNIYKVIPFGHQAAFVKRSLFNEIGEFDLSYIISADHEWFVRAFIQGKRFKEIDIPVVEYLDGGYSSQNPIKTRVEKERIFQKYAEFFFPNGIPVEEKERIKKDRDTAVIRYGLINNQPEIKQFFEKYKGMEIVVWGAGSVGKDIASFLIRNNHDVVFMVDSNKGYYGSRMMGLSIKPPECLNEFDGLVIIGVSRSENEVLKSLYQFRSNMRVITLSDISHEIM